MNLCVTSPHSSMLGFNIYIFIVKANGTAQKSKHFPRLSASTVTPYPRDHPLAHPTQPPSPKIFGHVWRHF